VHKVKWLVVWFLEQLCWVLDNVPAVWRSNGKLRFYRHGQWGCYPFKLSTRSDELDQRWQTGVWKAPKVKRKDFRES
jgi:hypothetical protein